MQTLSRSCKSMHIPAGTKHFLESDQIGELMFPSKVEQNLHLVQKLYVTPTMLFYKRLIGCIWSSQMCKHMFRVVVLVVKPLEV